MGSLKWLLLGKVVAGPMKGSEMKVLTEEYWQWATWNKIEQNFDFV
jgi:hypothetical protein